MFCVVSECAVIQETIKRCHSFSLVSFLNTLLLTGLFCHLVLQMPYHSPSHLPLSRSKSMSMDKMGPWSGGGEGFQCSTLLLSQLCLVQCQIFQTFVLAPQLLLPFQPSLRHWEESQSRHHLDFSFQISNVISECCLNLFCLISRWATQQLHLRSWRLIMRI